jgi:hypothetical protein
MLYNEKKERKKKEQKTTLNQQLIVNCLIYEMISFESTNCGLSLKILKSINKH